MKLGVVINETWAFFHAIFADFQDHHPTSLYRKRTLKLPLFQERVNRHIATRDLRDFLRSHDVVFFEWASEYLMKASRLPKTCGIVTRLHRYEIYQWADHINWNAVDRIILVSKAKEREFASRFPEQKHKIVVIPEAISLGRFIPREKKFQGDIGILCHLSPRKRVYDLILTFYELVQQGGEFHLHIGGGAHTGYPDYPHALDSLVRRLELQNKVTFYGNVSMPEDWYEGIDIFVSNSYSEGLQVSPLEAIASGCYCLSHWWDGANELLPTEALFFTERELIKKVEEYTSLTELERASMRQRQHEIIRDRFDIENTKVRIRETVEEVAVMRVGDVSGS